MVEVFNNHVDYDYTGALPEFQHPQSEHNYVLRHFGTSKGKLDRSD